jgi:hypothetical protein
MVERGELPKESYPFLLKKKIKIGISSFFFEGE